VTTAAAGARSEADFFERLAESGLLVRQRHGRGGGAGRAEGYAVALPGHTDASGEPVWYGGYRLDGVSGPVLDGGAAQDEFSEAHRRLIPDVQPRGTPRRRLVTSFDRGDVGQPDTQPQQPAAQVPRNTWQAEEPFGGGPQEPVLGDVRRVLLMDDLDGGEFAVMPPNLVGLSQPPAHNQGRLLDGAIPLEKPLAEGPVSLPLEKMCEYG
jgi:hypothetical protein